MTGGSGFIGSYTVRELLSRGYEVVAFDRFKKDVPEGVEFFLGDIQDDVAVTEFAAHVDGIIHLAGTLGTTECIDNPRPAAYTNIMGGLNLLEAATQYNIPLQCIAVGNWFEYSTYSITKTTVERFAVMYRKHRGTKVSVMRALNAFGAGQSVAAPYGNSKVRKLLPSIICRAIAGDPLELYSDAAGNASQIMDMVWVGDVARTLVDSLEYTEVRGPIEHVLECGSGRDTTVDDIAQLVVEAVGQGEIIHLPMRKGETPGSIVLADTSTLEELGFNYAASFSTLEERLPETVDYFRKYLQERNG